MKKLRLRFKSEPSQLCLSKSTVRLCRSRRGMGTFCRNVPFSASRLPWARVPPLGVLIRFRIPPKCLTFSRVTARNQVAHTLFEDWSVLFWCVLLEITSFPSHLGSGWIPAVVSPCVVALAPFLSRGCEWGSMSLPDGDRRAKPSLWEGARIRGSG